MKRTHPRNDIFNFLYPCTRSFLDVINLFNVILQKGTQNISSLSKILINEQPPDCQTIKSDSAQDIFFVFLLLFQRKAVRYP